MENKDNLPKEASENQEPKVEETTEVKEARVYAGKFKSVDDLEKSYTELEKLKGKKDFSEKLGEQVISATGYTVDDLEKAGYSPEEIVTALTSYQNTGKQPDMPKADNISQRVESSKYDDLAFELKLRDYFEDNPDAKDFKEEIREFKKMYKDLSPEEIFEMKISKFVSKGKEKAEASHSAKEKASLDISNATPPVADQSKEARERYARTGHIDDAVDIVSAKLKSSGWFGK